MAQLQIRNIVRVAQAFNDLGWAVQEQVEHVLNGDLDACNPAALERIGDWLDTVARLLDSETATDMAEELEAYLAS